MIKFGNLIMKYLIKSLRKHSGRVAKKVSEVKCFCNGYENLLITPNNDYVFGLCMGTVLGIVSFSEHLVLSQSQLEKFLGSTTSQTNLIRMQNGGLLFTAFTPYSELEGCYHDNPNNCNSSS
jgi:hypothetical protein